MIGWIARVVLLRVLPRRLVPLLTVIQLIRMARSLRGRRRLAVNEPTASRTARPPRVPPTVPR